MAANTRVIIALSVLGVAAVGVTIYLVTKKPATTTTNIPTATYPYGSSLPYGTQQRPATNTGIIPQQQQQNPDSWWQQPLGQAGGLLLNNVINSIFSPKSSSSSNTNNSTAMNTDYSGYNSNTDYYSTDYYSV